MTVLGVLFGYDGLGNDLLGVNVDNQVNCEVCGTCAMTHSPAQEAECFRKLYANGIAGAREISEARWAKQKKGEIAPRP
ncbi:MAG: hypothetical protein WBM11_10225 [Terriglobales bacterium]